MIFIYYMIISSLYIPDAIQHRTTNFCANPLNIKKQLTHQNIKTDYFEKNTDTTINSLFCANKLEYETLISSLKYFLKRDRGVDHTIYNCRTPKEKNRVLLGGYDNPYSKAPYDLLGLIPYCGFFDISLDINHFLQYSKNGVLPTVPEGKIPKGNKLLLDTDSHNVKDFIKCLNYSLSKLDEKYGVYQGTVYRGGIFDGGIKQYYSTSSEIVPYLQINSQRQNDLQFHIINTKSGHKIYKFQEDYYMPNGIKRIDFEKEVLLSSGTYKEVENREKYMSQIKHFAKELSLNLTERDKKYTPEYLESKIKVWEEI